MGTTVFVDFAAINLDYQILIHHKVSWSFRSNEGSHPKTDGAGQVYEVDRLVAMRANVSNTAPAGTTAGDSDAESSEVSSSPIHVNYVNPRIHQGAMSQHPVSSPKDGTLW